MSTITGFTAARMLEIEGNSIVDGEIDGGGNLILTRYDGTTIDAGPVKGTAGPQGPQGSPGVAGISSIPGEIKAWPNDVLPQQGTYGKWVWADGTVYATATYPIAASHIHANWKTAYGQSDPGAGNFRVPDLRGLIMSGLDQMPGGARANRMTRSVALIIAAKTGEETHIITANEIAAHTHILGTSAAGSGNAGGTDDGTAGYGYGSKKTGGVVGGGGGGAHENVQPTVFIPYIVRLDG